MMPSSNLTSASIVLKPCHSESQERTYKWQDAYKTLAHVLVPTSITCQSAQQVEAAAPSYEASRRNAIIMGSLDNINSSLTVMMDN